MSKSPIGPGPACSARPDTSLRWTLAGLSLTMFMPSLDTSIANAGLPALAAAFEATFPQVQWIVLAYLLAITVFIVSAGRLGDRLGRRRLLLAGIALFTAASIACGLAPTLAGLVAARAAQGLGAAVMMALTVAFAADVVPGARTGTVMGLLGTASAIGTTVGPSVGGLLIASLGWRAIFLINAPVGVLAFGLARRHLPADRLTARDRIERFDLPGMMLLAVTLVPYALAMTTGRGGFDRINWALLLAAICGAGLFAIAQARSTSPLVRVTLFRDPSVRAGLALSALVSTVMMTTLVVGPFYLARALGLQPAVVGLALSAGPLVAALCGVPAGRVVDQIGACRVTVAGLAGIAAGASLLAVVPASFGIPGYVVPLVVMTASYAMFQAANNTAVMSGVGTGERGVVSGLLSLSRNLGLVTGASVMGAVFARATGSIDLTTAASEAVAAGMRVTFAAAAGLMVVAIVIALADRDREARRALAGAARARPRARDAARTLP